MVEQETVVGWLKQQGIHDYDTGPDFVQGGFRWALSFRPENRFLAVAAHRDVEWNDLALQISVNISPEHLEGLRALSPEARERLWYDLRIFLLQKPVGYSLDFTEEEEEETPMLASVTVGYNLLEDNLRKAGFFRRHHQLQSSVTLAVQVLKRAIRFGG